MEIFCNIINVFPVILDQLYVSLLNRSIKVSYCPQALFY